MYAFPEQANYPTEDKLFTGALVSDPGSRFISQPITDFFSPGKYKLKAVYNQLSSDCHKVTREYFFDFVHIQTSFAVGIGTTFTVRDTILIDITSITTLLPAYFLKRIEVDLCLPLKPSNQPTDPLACTPLVFFQSFSSFAPSLPQISIPDKLFDVGYYNISIRGFFGTVARTSYVYSKTIQFEVLNTEIRPLLNFFTKAVTFYQISENVRVDCSLDLVWLSAQGVEVKRTRLPFDLTKPTQDVTIEGYTITKVHWKMKPLNPLIVLNYDQIIASCNNPPSEICNINPFVVMVPDNYELEVSYTLTNTFTGLVKDYKKAYQFTYTQTDLLFASIDRQASKYNVQDLRFSARK